jgi:hypothetical protein
MQRDVALLTRIHNLSDEELVQMINAASDYRPEAISYAQEELSRRGGLDVVSDKIILSQQQDEDAKKTIEAKKKHSLLHAWGGASLFVFADKSGLLNAFIAPFHSNPTSAGMVAGLLVVGMFVAGGFLSSSLVKVIDSSSLSPKSKTIIKRSLPIAYLIGAFLLARVTAPIITSVSSNISILLTLIMIILFVALYAGRIAISKCRKAKP